MTNAKLLCRVVAIEMGLVLLLLTSTMYLHMDDIGQDPIYQMALTPLNVFIAAILIGLNQGFKWLSWQALPTYVGFFHILLIVMYEYFPHLANHALADLILGVVWITLALLSAYYGYFKNETET